MNGWRNRATWLVNLWYNPETKEDIEYLEETLEDDFLEMVQLYFGTTAHFYVDLIDFTVIDWDDLRLAIPCEDEEE